MTVTLRKRKQGKNGKISLYLDIYKGKTISSTGKTEYIREYEYLDLFILDKPKTEADKLQNQKTLSLAKKTQNKRMLEYNTARLGLTPDTNSKDTNFYEHYYARSLNIRPLFIKVLKNFAGEHLKFSEITKSWCEKYLDYLHTLHDTRRTKHPTKNTITINTILFHWRVFSAALNQAVKDEVILFNPCKLLKSPKVEDNKKEYLTLSELKSFVKADCSNANLKRAFLFSCLTGLRWSDVSKLKWSEIQEDDTGKYHIVYKQKKTKGLNYLPLSEQALQYMGERGEPNTNVFNLPKISTNISKHLSD